MADQNQAQFYRAQGDAIDALFQTADADADWQSLATQCEAALSDPALPRYYRANFHIINAWCVDDVEAELQLKWARETLDDMVQVLYGSSQDDIDTLLKPMQEMLEVTEAALEKDKTELATTADIFRTQAGKKKKVRRVDSGVGSSVVSEDESSGWQEFDKKAKDWVKLGTGEDPAAEDEMLLGYYSDPPNWLPESAPGFELSAEFQEEKRRVLQQAGEEADKVNRDKAYLEEQQSRLQRGLSIREGPAGGDLPKAEEEGEINSDNEILLAEAAEEKKDDEDGDKE